MIEDHAIAPVDKASDSGSLPLKKRKMPATFSSKNKMPGLDLTQQDRNEASSPMAKRKKDASARKAKNEEKRLRRFRSHAPSSYLERLNRATTQR